MKSAFDANVPKRKPRTRLSTMLAEIEPKETIPSEPPRPASPAAEALPMPEAAPAPAEDRPKAKAKATPAVESEAPAQALDVEAPTATFAPPSAPGVDRVPLAAPPDVAPTARAPQSSAPDAARTQVAATPSPEALAAPAVRAPVIPSAPTPVIDPRPAPEAIAAPASSPARTPAPNSAPIAMVDPGLGPEVQVAAPVTDRAGALEPHRPGGAFGLALNAAAPPPLDVPQLAGSHLPAPDFGPNATATLHPAPLSGTEPTYSSSVRAPAQAAMAGPAWAQGPAIGAPPPVAPGTFLAAPSAERASPPTPHLGNLPHAAGPSAWAAPGASLEPRVMSTAWAPPSPAAARAPAPSSDPSLLSAFGPAPAAYGHEGLASTLPPQVAPVIAAYGAQAQAQAQASSAGAPARARIERLKQRLDLAARRHAEPSPEPSTTASRVKETVGTLKERLERSAQEQRATLQALEQARRAVTETQGLLEAERRQRIAAEGLAEERQKIALGLVAESEAMAEERDQALARIAELRAVDEEQAKLLDGLERELDAERARAEEARHQVVELRSALEAVNAEVELAEVRLDQLRAEKRAVEERAQKLENEILRSQGAREALTEIQRLVESLG